MQRKFVRITSRALPKSQKFKEESESFRKLLKLIKPQVKSRKKNSRGFIPVLIAQGRFAGQENLVRH